MVVRVLKSTKDGRYWRRIVHFDWIRPLRIF